MHFHIYCVALALTVSSTTAVPEPCTITAINHGEVGNYITRRYGSRECFHQLQPGESVDNADSVTLRCQKGYLPARSPQTSNVCRFKEDVVICKDGTWSKPLLCEAEITCGEPPPIEFATVTSLFPEDYPLGAIVAYECQPGYVIKGRSTTSQCVISDDGSQAVWTKASMSCTDTTPLPTKDRGKIPNSATREASIFSSPVSQNEEECSCTYNYTSPNTLAIVGHEKLLPGSKIKKGDLVVFTCQRQEMVFSFPNGLRISGSMIMTCHKCQAWKEGDVPSCVLRNQDNCLVPFIENGVIQERKYKNTQWDWKAFRYGVETFYENVSPGAILSHGAQLYLHCNDQKSVQGSGRAEISCSKGKLEPVPVCMAAPVIRCPAVDSKGIFQVTYSSDRKIDTTVSYTCGRRGYALHGQGVRTCQQNGEWSGDEPQCLPEAPVIRCPAVDSIGIFQVTYSSDRKINTTVSYTCRRRGHILHGQSLRTCQQNGEWSGDDPQCLPEAPVIRCPSIDVKDIFIVNYSNDRKINSTVFYSCKQRGYKISGRRMRTCQQNGEWAGVDPECLGEDFNGCALDAEILSRNLEIDPIKKLYSFGEFVEFSCSYGFELTPHLERMMCLGSEWSDKVPDCKKKNLYRKK